MKKILSLLSLCACLQLTGNEIDSWSSPPEIISTLGVDASSAQTAIDGSGNAVAIWLEGDVVISKNKPISGDWGTSTQISSTGASSPQIVVDPSGNATAIWLESGVVKTASQPFGSSWGSSTTLSGASSSSPQLAVDTATGDVIAIWATGGAIESATLLFGGSWPGSPDTLASTASAAPQVAISSGGTVVAIWHTLNSVSSLYNINVATKTTPSGSWSVASTISNPSLNSVYPVVAIDDLGNIFAIWYRYNLSGVVYSNVVLQGANLLVGNSWTTPVDISDSGQENPANLDAKIQCSEMGAIALWTNSIDGTSFSIETASTDSNQMWTPSTVLINSLYSYAVSMNTNSEGDAFGIYMNYDTPSSSILINTVETHIGGLLSGSWLPSTNLSTGTFNAFPNIAPVLSGGTNSYASAVWLGYDGSNTVVYSSFGTGSVISPPSNVVVTQNVNDFKVFQEYANTVTWDASSDPDLNGYAVYRNGAFLTSVDSGTLEFVDNTQLEGGPVTYGVSAADDTGTESLVISASFP